MKFLSLLLFVLLLSSCAYHPMYSDYASESSEEEYVDVNSQEEPVPVINDVEESEDSLPEITTTVYEVDSDEDIVEYIRTYDEDSFLDEQEEIDADRVFEWTYQDIEFTLAYDLNEADYEFYSERNRNRAYIHFVNDNFDDEFISSIASDLEDLALDAGLPDWEVPYVVTSFVQSLPYTSDSLTTGFDEYPRFPYETIYDNGGDCEDTSILVAALLSELDYDVVLIGPPGHMAVGVAGDDSMYGGYYEFEGTNYFYLETTGENWDVGQIPYEYVGLEVDIFPLYIKPELQVEASTESVYDFYDNYVDVDVEVTNLGSIQADNVIIYVGLETEDTSQVWDQIESDEFDLEPEETITWSVENLRSPVGETYRVYIQAYGDNVISDEMTGDWVYWN